MVSMGTFSKELCGGTHLTNTGEVEQFEILSEEGVSAGTRRITALTGARAKEHVQQIEAAGNQAAKMLGVAAHEIANAVTALSHHARELRKQMTSGSDASSAQPKTPWCTSIPFRDITSTAPGIVRPTAAATSESAVEKPRSSASPIGARAR